MLMPAMLPEHLNIYSSTLSDLQLSNSLKAHPSDYLEFFAYACDDENWRSDHQQFISESLEWMTEQYLAYNITRDNAIQISNIIKQHYLGLEPLLPKNIICEVLGGSLQINSLLYQASSLYFEHTIHNICFQKKEKQFSVPGIFLSELKIINEFINTEEVKELWKLEDAPLKRLLEIALRINLFGLAELCQQLFSHRLNIVNIYPELIEAQNNSWEYLRQQCAERINLSAPGLEITLPDAHSLCCYIERITEHSLDNFRKIMPIVTQVICGPKAYEDKDFVSLVQACPKLISLDIGRADRYSHQLTLLPQQLKELILSGSTWLTDEPFKAILEHNRSIQSLILVGCNFITARGWGELLKLPRLYHLNISNCSSIGDKEFSIILDGTGGLVELEIASCEQITEKGFQLFSKGNRLFEFLNFAHTNISDASLTLVVEQQKKLKKIDISGTPYVTENGIIETLRIGRELQELHCSYYHIPEGIINDLRKKYPDVKITL